MPSSQNGGPMTPRRRSARLSATPEPQRAPASASKSPTVASSTLHASLADIQESDHEGEISECQRRGASGRRQNDNAHKINATTSMTTARELREDPDVNTVKETAILVLEGDKSSISKLTKGKAQNTEAMSSTSLAAHSFRRKRQLAAKLRLDVFAAVLPPVFILLGYLVPLVLPIPPLGPWYDRNANNGISKGTYVDENALQPGQAFVYFDYKEDVKLADEVADSLATLDLGAWSEGERHPPWLNATLGKMSPAQRDYLAEQFAILGLKPFIQHYDYRAGASAASPYDGPLHLSLSGSNIFARFPSPRTDAREAIVIAAPWFSSWNDIEPEDSDEGKVTYQRRVNVRGVALTIALARYLTTQPHLSRDLIFVLSDGHLAGMQAFLSTYFATNQSNLITTTYRFKHSLAATRPAEGTVGDDHTRGSVIWNALALDFPSDSFSAIELLHEGLNGQLPNMDVLNAVVRVAEHIDGVPVKIPGLASHSPIKRMLLQLQTWTRAFKAPLEATLGTTLWTERTEGEYVESMERLSHQIGLQALGKTTGVHGLFTRYHIDALTLRAVPASGPYGFYHMGRIAEGTIRTYNNLLERLHHSQYFYLLTSPYRFVPFGIYILASILISVGLTFYALRSWTCLGRAVQEGRLRVYEEHRRAIVGDDDATLQRLDAPLVRPTTEHLIRELGRLSELTGTSMSAQQFEQITTDLKQQGRPVGLVLGIMGVCHLIGFFGLRMLARFQVRCAREGILVSPT
ncbi:Gaa1-domain-containing protein [Tilletiaria anomala UBC 951]|uniref:Gaa1-domain-containing protein n=1 Tax=Tilletiaria anomala (strain ATCC 24038 / CBS 436.72 / UBC 951) TaxID=1037660 RepID=A0A066WPV8_TILAU|nr:Gaa1-domain-containing protein [Tilletiaria anomala UBC 951]KDN52665.1 Gaa1-domain-containing protein [Tilletiaria anomala UBC 951]